MGNAFVVVATLVRGLVKRAGLTEQTIEIEPGTVMNIWVPKETVTKNDKGVMHMHIPPTKPAVVFLHAFTLDGISTWFPQVLALTREYSVYVPDLLFFGGSITDRSERSASFQAEFVAKGLGLLKVESVTVVGLSYGGMVAFEMAKLYPMLVKTVVVTATVVEMTESISRDTCKQFGVTKLSNLLMPETPDELKMLFSLGFHKFPWLPRSVYRDILETMYINRKERNELLAELVVPDKEATSYTQDIHMVWGDKDKIFDLDFATAMKKQLGDKTKLHWIKDAGHLVQIEKPFKFNKCLKCILKHPTKNH